MATQVPLPTTNLTMADVRDTLAAYGGSVDNTLESFFTTDAKINMWSKYKPVVSNDDFLNTDKRWQGANGKCGLTIPAFSSVSAFRTGVTNGTTGWSYTPPTGGSSAPYRLGDFRGYCATAVNPIGDCVSNGLKDSNNYVQFDIDVAVSGSSTTNLTLTDICLDGYQGTPLSEYYLGVYVFNSSSWAFLTGTDPIGSAEALSAKIQISGSGNFSYMPFLSSAAQTGTGVTATFIGCNIAPKNILIQSSSSLQAVIASGTWNKSAGTITDLFVTLQNNGSSSYTFSSIRITLMYTTSSSQTPAEGSTVTYKQYSSSVTVAANSEKIISISGSFSASEVSGRTYWLAGSATNVTTTYNGVDESGDESAD